MFGLQDTQVIRYEAGGKVIIIDIVKGSNMQDVMSEETKALFDLFIMYIDGVERHDHEWANIFKRAGFSDYKIVSVLGVRSVIEVYP